MEKFHVCPYFNVGPGSYTFDYKDEDMIDLDFHREQLRNEIKSDNAKKTGAFDLNRFAKMEPLEDRKKISRYINKMVGQKLAWGWEYFHSGEPAGLHTDWQTDYYCKKDCYEGRNGDMTHRTDVVAGCIIPLEWNTPVTPHTVNYNKLADNGKKLMYSKGELREFRNKDVVIPYRGEGTWRDWSYDPEVFKYHPIGSNYLGEFAELKVHSAYTWEVGTFMLFDPVRYHSSSWFLSARHLPKSYDEATEWKRAIVGFATLTWELATGKVA